MSENENTSYSCKTCGKISTSRGHLCTPIQQEEKIVCGHCGDAESDLRHVCAPKVSSLKFSCGTCGRVAVTETDLCSPVEIGPDKNKPVEKGCCCG
ncbi:MAG: hypothetical protein ACUZ8H_04075 [Candidatus Anammoxibacter sp.]